MLEISVKFFASLAEKIGERETTILMEEGSNFQDLLEKLQQRYGERFAQIMLQSDGNIKEIYKILLNEKNIYDQNIFNIKLNNKDIIAFLPPIGGGC
ncbi:MAG: MoaD/ThiS family protein [Candidatus Helarchaeota archaeon]